VKIAYLIDPPPAGGERGEDGNKKEGYADRIVSVTGALGSGRWHDGRKAGRSGE